MNTFFVTKIQFFDEIMSSVDWIYGTDDNSINGCSLIDLKEVAMDDRQSIQIVGEFLKTNLGLEFFAEKDIDLQTNQSVRQN